MVCISHIHHKKAQFPFEVWRLTIEAQCFDCQPPYLNFQTQCLNEKALHFIREVQSLFIEPRSLDFEAMSLAFLALERLRRSASGVSTGRRPGWVLAATSSVDASKDVQNWEKWKRLILCFERIEDFALLLSP